MKPEKVIEDNERSKISLKSLEKVILRYPNQFLGLWRGFYTVENTSREQ
jgi:hypothetical protein